MPLLGLGMHTHHEDEMRAFVSTASHSMVMLVFIILGANLPWRAMADHFWPGLAVLATLILVARPLVVLGSLLVDRRGGWSWPEIVFVAWTRETGVVPAALAGIVVSMGVPDADLVVTCVALAIIVTLGLQSTTKRWLAHRLRLVDVDAQQQQPPPPPGFAARAGVAPTPGS
jgi:cell volume regulation protein A